MIIHRFRLWKPLFMRGERVKGIEPSYAVWETAVLPLNYTRDLRGLIARRADLSTEKFWRLSRTLALIAPAGKGLRSAGLASFQSACWLNSGGMSLGEFPSVFEGVDVVDGFVAADALDAGETQGEAAGVAIAWLDRVEGDFEDDVGFYFHGPAVLRDGVSAEVFGELLDLFIG